MMMRISDLISELSVISQKHGNLWVVVTGQHEADTRDIRVMVKDDPFKPRCSNCIIQTDL